MPSAGEPGDQRAVAPPNRGFSSHQWNPPGSPMVVLDALTLSRDVVAEWQLLLRSVGLL
ncbi:hypothetical protein [Frankia sp. AiPa1]|uniref:hypothetical protein n=1 Tax=Frankia sp. AiPa1 TaxID=573492 RepID=UPI00202B0446|nr:hypothetical protein [Frankia sp. AiPa1]MCL9759423.1 hypothetical protein [Frankia sp. AiPa1]